MLSNKTKRFQLIHRRQGETGYIAILRLGKFAYAGWIGYGKPVWWMPRFLGSGNGEYCKYGFGFGWLLLCFRVQIVSLDKKKVEVRYEHW